MLNKNEMIHQLKHDTITIVFTKKDGSKRVMQATLQQDLIQSPTYSSETARSNTNTNLLTVWDTEKDGWRAINIDTIKSFG